MSAVFALRLINAIKKNKSFEIELWTQDQVNLLMAPIKYQVKAVKVEKA